MDPFVIATLATLVAVIGAVPPAAYRAAPPGPEGRDTIPLAAAQFRAEHDVLLGTFGRALGKAVAPQATRTDRASLVLFLRADLLPHASAEEAVLYRATDSVLGTRGYATATMVLDHQAIARLADELAALAPAPDPEAFRRRACALDALVQSHFAKEEEFLLPILRQKMSDADLQALFARLQRPVVQGGNPGPAQRRGPGLAETLASRSSSLTGSGPS